MSEKYLILDCDGVLLDWVGGFREFLVEECGIVPEHPEPKEFDLTGWIGAPSRQDMFSLVERFNHNEGGYFDSLKPLPGVEIALNNLKNDGFRLHIITACSSSAATIRARERNLISVFGTKGLIDEVKYVGLKDSKSPLLRGYPPSIFVEDNVQNAHIGAFAGHKTYLMSASHNINEDLPDSITRVDDWNTLSEKLSTSHQNFLDQTCRENSADFTCG